MASKYLEFMELSDLWHEHWVVYNAPLRPHWLSQKVSVQDISHVVNVVDNLHCTAWGTNGCSERCLPIAIN